jgi:hypothetical protein
MKDIVRKVEDRMNISHSGHATSACANCNKAVFCQSLSLVLILAIGLSLFWRIHCVLPYVVHQGFAQPMQASSRGYTPRAVVQTRR